MTALHSASILASALLLFLIEPMVAKALLPLYGGSPAVWNTCLLFFQGLLLAGYAYAHFAGRLLGRRGHLMLHAALLLLPLALLPPHLPSGGPAPSAWPVPSLLGALALAVGLPFFVLSTNSSMVQAWHAERSGKSPYFLYAASNAGSFLALLAYPFAVEPLAGTRAQLRAWSFGYAAFVAVSALALWGAWRARPASEEARPRPVAAARRWRWALRAAVPSSLLLAVSLRITTDVAAIPLLWVVPLAIYLCTFIFAFWPRMIFPRRVLVVVGALAIALTLGTPSLGRGLLWLSLGLPLTLLLIGGWLCHGDLARDRPEPENVTEYYLWIAVGGFAGGVFGNLVAPLLFTSIAEFPLSLALVAILFSVGDDQGAAFAAELKRPANWLRLLATAVVFIGWTVLAKRLESPPSWFGQLPLWMLFGSLLLGWLPGQFAAATLGAALVSAFVVVPGTRTVEARRSFFGVARVRESDGLRRLVHGTTWHGMQKIGDPTPLLYYVPLSPLSRAVTLQPDGANIAVVGLGTGSVAHYVRTGQTLRFYELDPIIEPLARRWFTFLDESPGQVSVLLGDARLTLAEQPEASLDLMLIDAFSSDAIPVHLMTVEAVEMFMSKLKPEGFVVFHISNRHLDLKPVLRAIARKLQLQAALVEFDPDEEENASQVEAVALARTRAPLQKLLDRGWVAMGHDRDHEVLWTDDRSSLLSVITK
jgi:hypothetical protein